VKTISIPELKRLKIIPRNLAQPGSDVPVWDYLSKFNSLTFPNGLFIDLCGGLAKQKDTKYYEREHFYLDSMLFYRTRIRLAAKKPTYRHHPQQKRPRPL
jgi:hypothetical protein